MRITKEGGEATVGLKEDGMICLEIEDEGKRVAGLALRPLDARKLGVDLIKAANEALIRASRAQKKKGENHGRTD